MKPFVLDRYGRIVFPFNFLPELDFSVFDTLEEFEAVIRRDGNRIALFGDAPVIGIAEFNIASLISDHPG